MLLKEKLTSQPKQKKTSKREQVKEKLHKYPSASKQDLDLLHLFHRSLSLLVFCRFLFFPVWLWLLLGSLKDQLGSSSYKRPPGGRKGRRRTGADKRRRLPEGGKRPEEKAVKTEEGSRSKGKNDHPGNGGQDADGWSAADINVKDASLPSALLCRKHDVHRRRDATEDLCLVRGPPFSFRVFNVFFPPFPVRERVRDVN